VYSPNLDIVQNTLAEHHKSNLNALNMAVPIIGGAQQTKDLELVFGLVNA